VAGTNVTGFKAAAVELLAPILYPVPVEFAYNANRAEREYVYFGHATAPRTPMTFRAAQRLPRQEEATIFLFIQVRMKTAEPADAEARAAEIFQQVEEAFATDPNFGERVPGVMAVWGSDLEIKSFWLDDTTAASDFMYQLTVQSRLV